MALEFVPTVGGGLSTVTGLIWGSAHRRRVEEFLDDLDDRLRALEISHDELARLLESEEGTTLGIAAAAAAGRASADKRALLATALVVLLEREEEEIDLRLILIQLIDSLTVTEMRVLDLLAGPQEWAARRGAAIRLSRDERDRIDVHELLIGAVPATADLSLAQACLMDLESRGLLSVSMAGDPMDATFADEDLTRGVASELGHRLLDLVRGALEFPAG